MSKLKPEVREAWVTALRSGDYAQGGRMLRSNIGPRFCCLGVLCDLGVQDEELLGIEVEARFLDEEDGPHWVYGMRNSETFRTDLLPAEIANAAGINNSSGRFRRDMLPPDWADKIRNFIQELVDEGKIGLAFLHEDVSLSELNDHGWTFGEIADLIEVVDDNHAWGETL